MAMTMTIPAKAPKYANMKFPSHEPARSPKVHYTQILYMLK